MKPSVIITALVLALGIAMVFYFGSWGGPGVTLAPDSGTVSAGPGLEMKLQSRRADLREVMVTATQAGKTVDVVKKRYPAGTTSAQEKISLEPAGFQEGQFQLRVRVSDSSIFNFRGNTTTLDRSYVLDVRPPVVAVLSTAHNVSRGGAGLVTYTVSEEPQRTGVTFGGRFVPGYRQGGETFACLFPFPHDIEASLFVPRVSAVDRAGNEGSAGIYYRILEKRFPSDRIPLSDAFLEKTAAEFRGKFPGTKTPLELFLKANRELRDKDTRVFADLAVKTSSVPLWKDAFLRLPNSAPVGSFAQTRSYFHGGEKVDEQVHLGVDLASLAHAPVPAANSGKVVWADELGIYGQCIVIDHGLGLQTVYGHLSRMSVKIGDIVEKGAIIGNTGATGMAVGDHLHFGVNVAGVPVNPVEWWDPAWIKNNFTNKLHSAKPQPNPSASVP